MAQDQTHGSCLCKAITYTFTGAPAMQALCHCPPCRKISGGAYTTNLLLPLTSLHITSSPPLTAYSMTHPSGMTLKYHFCEKCGTKIYKEGNGFGFVGMAILQAGTLDGKGGEGEGMRIEDMKVGAELYVKDRVSWVGETAGAGQCREFS